MANRKSPLSAAQQTRPEIDDEDDGMDFRVEREPQADREQRGNRLDAVAERTLTDAERLDMFRLQYMQARLPDLPTIPGFHVCWLSTSNQSDSIQWRTRLGYTPITAEDVPGFTHMTLKTGEFAGLIGVNEMLAYKLPEDLYQMYMAEAHHNAPLSEDEKIASRIESMREQLEGDGGKLIEGDGMKELRERRAPRAPRFA